MDFLGPHFGESPVELAQIISGEKIAFAAQQLYTKIRFRFFCGLGKEERTKFRKKKKEKKGKKGKKRKNKGKKRKKNLIAAKSGLVGMKGNLETFNPMKYSLPYLSRF